MGYYVILSLEDERYFSFDDHLLYEKGVPVEKDLKGIAFYVYKYLATHSPNYIDRERIFDDVWVLEMKKSRPRNQASYRDKIPLLRKYLGDTSEPFKYIESDGNYRYRSKQRAFYTDDIDAYILEKKGKGSVPLSTMSAPEEEQKKGYKFSDFVLNLKTGQPELDIEIEVPRIVKRRWPAPDYFGGEVSTVFNKEKGSFEEIVTYTVPDTPQEYDYNDDDFVEEEDTEAKEKWKKSIEDRNKFNRIPLNAIFNFVTKCPRYSAFETMPLLKSLFVKNKKVKIEDKTYKIVDMVDDSICVMTNINNSWDGGFFDCFREGVKPEYYPLRPNSRVGHYMSTVKEIYMSDVYYRFLYDIDSVPDLYSKELDDYYEELTLESFDKLSTLQIINFLSTNYKYTYLSTQPSEEVLMLKLKIDEATEQYFNLVDTVFVEGKNVAVLLSRLKKDCLYSYFAEEDGKIKLDVIDDERLIREIESEYRRKAFDRIKSGVRNTNEIKYPTT